MVWSEALRNRALAEKLEAAMATMVQDMAVLVRTRRQAGAWTPVAADVVAQAILSILPGFLLSLAMAGPDAVAGFPAAVRALFPD
jgi:hypothetical protein